MSVQFIRGTAVADLEAPLIQATKQWLEEDAQHEVFYLVPNHIKFEQEIQVLQKLRQLQTTTSDSITSTRLQVFSFYRLAWYYLQHTPFYSALFSNYFSFIKKCAKAILKLRSFIHF